MLIRAVDAKQANVVVIINAVEPDIDIGVLSVQTLVARGGVVSVVESMVSVMEAHTPASRGLLNQKRIEDEILVSWNGEDIYHCDGVVREAMKAYKGNFIRRSGKVKDYLVSKAIDSEVKKPAKLKYMAKE